VSEELRCGQGHAMRVSSSFRFDHEEGDSERDAESLRLFEAMGIELGAEVTVWQCPTCGDVRAEFHYDEEEAHDG
jgi:hypothetical protein